MSIEMIGECVMLAAAMTFLIIAIVSGVLGFGVIAGTAALIAKVLFFLFIIMFIGFLITGGRRSVPWH
jgi:uncharacterized membrane protein YtjA (UPF0391 family)